MTDDDIRRIVRIVREELADPEIVELPPGPAVLSRRNATFPALRWPWRQSRKQQEDA